MFEGNASAKSLGAKVSSRISTSGGSEPEGPGFGAVLESVLQDQSSIEEILDAIEIRVGLESATNASMTAVPPGNLAKQISSLSYQVSTARLRLNAILSRF